jgi:hypothetical protein
VAADLTGFDEEAAVVTRFEAEATVTGCGDDASDGGGVFGGALDALALLSNPNL